MPGQMYFPKPRLPHCPLQCDPATPPIEGSVVPPLESGVVTSLGEVSCMTWRLGQKSPPVSPSSLGMLTEGKLPSPQEVWLAWDRCADEAQRPSGQQPAPTANHACAIWDTQPHRSLNDCSPQENGPRWTCPLFWPTLCRQNKMVI